MERAALATLTARADFAKRKLDRNQTMFEEELLSDYERDELITEYRVAELTRREAEEKLRRRTVRSPTNGLVVRRDVSEGEYVSDKPVMELVALNPLYAEVVMRAEKYGELQTGMKVVVDIQNQQGSAIEGEIRIVDRVIDGASGTFGLRIELDNPGNAIPAGLKCSVKF